jgi:hypothetical protein
LNVVGTHKNWPVPEVLAVWPFIVWLHVHSQISTAPTR